jgi:N-acetylneuraminic acid mutarotase
MMTLSMLRSQPGAKRVAAGIVLGTLGLATGCTAALKPGAIGTLTPVASSHTTPAKSRFAATADHDLDDAVASARTPWRLPAARSREVALTWNGTLIVAGGLASSGTTSSILLIDPTTGAVSEAGHLAVATHDAAGAILSGAAYVFGGGAAATIDAVQRFVPGGDAVVVGHLPEPRSDLSVVVAGNEAFLVGGYDGTRWLPGILATSDGKRFRRAGTLAVPVRYAAVAAVGNALYVLGGAAQAGDVSDIQRMDLTTGVVQVVGHLPAPLSHATAGVIDEKVFVFGGRRGDLRQSTVFRFDPATNAVVPAGTLPFALSDYGASTIDGRTFLVGGETPALTNDIVVLRRQNAA